MPNNPPRREDNPVRKLAALGISPIQKADKNLMSNKTFKKEQPEAYNNYQKWKSGEGK